MKKNKYIDKDYIYIALLIIGIIIAISITFIDKSNCEKKGGIYIWEWGSEGTKCHIKGE